MSNSTEVPPPARPARKWWLALSIGVAVCLTPRTALFMQQALEPALGTELAFLTGILAAVAAGGLTVLMAYALTRRRRR
jgi:hypothetical protein